MSSAIQAKDCCCCFFFGGDAILDLLLLVASILGAIHPSIQPERKR